MPWGVDYNLTLCPLQGGLKHIYHGQPKAKVDLNPMPESTLSPFQGLWIWPLLSAFGFSSRQSVQAVSDISSNSVLAVALCLKSHIQWFIRRLCVKFQGVIICIIFYNSGGTGSRSTVRWRWCTATTVTSSAPRRTPLPRTSVAIIKTEINVDT